MPVNSNKQMKKGSSTEIFYFFGLVLYMLIYLSYETKWEYPEFVVWGMRMLVIFSLSVHLVLSFTRFQGKELLLLFICLIISIIVGNNASFQKGITLLFPITVTFLLVFGAKGIEFRKIVKTFFVVGGTYCVVTVIASLLGIIENYNDFQLNREIELDSVVFGNPNRMSLGYGWSTNMANHVFFILLCYLYYIHRPLKVVEIIVFLFVAFNIWWYTGSKLSAIMLLLIVLFSVFYKLKKGYKILTAKKICYFIIFSIPFFAFITYYASNAYDETDLFWVATDIFFTGRLHFGNDAIQEVGISMMGQTYIMNGNGREDGGAYNYVDASYMQLLIIYGLLYTIMIVVGYIFVCRKAYRNKDYFLLYSVLFAGISGMIAQHFIQIFENPFLISLFANNSWQSLSKAKL